MKFLFVFVLATAPGLCLSMTEDQAIATWKAECTDAGGEHKVDFVRAGDAAKTPHVVYVCEHSNGTQALRIAPAVSLLSTEKS